MDVGRGTAAPSTWGLGDGQAIPWEYAPAPESRDVVSIAARYDLFIGGKDVRPHGGRTFTTLDPATEEPLAEIALADTHDVDRAVAAARTAFETTWGPMPGRERAKYLYRIARILQERSREFAVLETLDGGKPIKESRDVDVPLAAAHFWYYAGWADKLEYAFPNRDPRPLGVAAQVIPWNFPLLMLAWKIAPALAAGNTVVLKPASATPLSALLFADVCRQADLPPGVVNIITGPGEIGLALVVASRTWTRSRSPAPPPWARRSVAPSRARARRSPWSWVARRPTSCSTTRPFDQAIEGVINGIFFNQGEVCCAGSRLLVQESIAEPFVERLKERLSTLRVGRPHGQEHRCRRHQQRRPAGPHRGAHRGGRRRGRGDVSAGLRAARPRLLRAAHVVHERHPVEPHRARGDLRAGAVRHHVPDAGGGDREGQQHAYGLSAGVWTEKGSRILAMASRLRAGVVWANTFNRFDPTSPFGGYKESGFGREGGLHGLLAYMDLDA